MVDERLTLPEEFLLLGWDDERGANGYTQNLAILLGGASILDLVLEERLTVRDGRLVVAGGPTGNAALDLVLDRIGESRKPRTIKTWVQCLGNRPRLRQVVLHSLVDRGILRQERRQILGLFPVTRHPVANPSSIGPVRDRVRRTLTETRPVDDVRDAALASLVKPAGGRLVRRLVTSNQRAAARRRAKQLSKGEGLSADIASAIGEANAAAIAAITAATISTSSASSS